MQRRIFWEIKDFKVRTLPTRATMLQEVEVHPTLVLFLSFGRIKGVFVLGTVWKKNGDFRVPVQRSLPRQRQAPPQRKSVSPK